MPSLLPLFIAFRFSYNRYHNSIISMSLISIFSIVSIALGVMVLIIGLSVINGFERELNQRILSVIPHGEIEPVRQPWKNWNDELKKIERIPGVFAGAYINFTGLVENGMNLRVVHIKGINPNQEENLGALPKFVDKVVWKNFKSGKQQIIMGKGVVDSLKIKKGDWISVTFSVFDTDYELHSFKKIYLQLTGVLQTNGQLDHNFALIPIEDAHQYLNMNNSVTGISIRVSNAFDADKLVHAAGAVIRSCVYVRSWMNNYGYMYRDIKKVRAIIYLSMILVIGVACFNVISILMMATKNRNKDIAILRTLGAKNSLIRSVFVWHGFLFGLTGSLLGSIIGTIISVRLSVIIDFLEKKTGHQFLLKDIYFINFIPSELRWLDVVYIISTVLLLIFIASWYPARQASHINPVDILRNGH